jgi:hypothetical protein
MAGKLPRPFHVAKSKGSCTTTCRDVPVQIVTMADMLATITSPKAAACSRKVRYGGVVGTRCAGQSDVCLAASAVWPSASSHPPTWKFYVQLDVDETQGVERPML